MPKKELVQFKSEIFPVSGTTTKWRKFSHLPFTSPCWGEWRTDLVKDWIIMKAENWWLIIIMLILFARDPVDCYESNYVYMGLQKAFKMDINKFAQIKVKDLLFVMSVVKRIYLLLISMAQQQRHWGRWYVNIWRSKTPGICFEEMLSKCQNSKVVWEKLQSSTTSHCQPRWTPYLPSSFD